MRIVDVKLTLSETAQPCAEVTVLDEGRQVSKKGIARTHEAAVHTALCAIADELCEQIMTHVKVRTTATF